MSSFSALPADRLVFLAKAEDASSPELLALVEKIAPSALLLDGPLADLGKAALLALRQHTAVMTNMPDEISRNKLDGVHIEPVKALKDERARFSSLNLGVGSLSNKHAAMEAGENGADYIGFGPILATWNDHTFEKTLELASWWADVMTIPCMIAAETVEEAEAALAQEVDYIAVSWQKLSAE